MPKSLKTYCKKCKSHKEHTLTLAKIRTRSSAHPLTRFGERRLKKRHYGKTGVGNKGRFSKPAVSKWKRTGAKSSKRPDLRLKCKECGKSNIKTTSSRLKKIAIE